MQGTIIKSLSGFYYVDTEGETVTCRGRGKLRHEKANPLVGDLVRITRLQDGTGTVEEILPRKNQFARPAVANIDQLVILCSGAIPVTDPYLIDRVAAIAQRKGCEVVICVNKRDLSDGDELEEIYRKAGFPTVCTSAVTGEGVETLRTFLSGKVSAFTGNSGVGKSSILNALEPRFSLETGEVSSKLGRGRHTTRHVELFRVGDALIADTPGFSSFDLEEYELRDKNTLAMAFREFLPYLGRCQFLDCSHTKERGCAILEAVEAGEIASSRHQSYLRLYEEAKSYRPWEQG